MSRPEFDLIDAAIVAEAQKLRAAEDLNRSYPREGDALVFSCGTVRHVSNAYEDSAQPTVGYDASFYLSKHGHMSFSGTLGASIPNKHFTPLPDRLEANAWTFHHGHACAHNGVRCKVMVRAWAVDAPWPKSSLSPWS